MCQSPRPAAFTSSAQLDASRISVEASEGEVTLRGKVWSWAEGDEAQQTVWSPPGVTQVRTEITAP